MAAQVLEIERSPRLGGLAPPGLGEVVEVASQGEDVGIGLLLLARNHLRRGQDLQQLPEEPHVDVAARVAHREVVQHLGRELVEWIGTGHGGDEITALPVAVA